MTSYLVNLALYNLQFIHGLDSILIINLMSTKTNCKYSNILEIFTIYFYIYVSRKRNAIRENVKRVIFK